MPFEAQKFSLTFTQRFTHPHTTGFSYVDLVTRHGEHYALVSDASTTAKRTEPATVNDTSFSAVETHLDSGPRASNRCRK